MHVDEAIKVLREAGYIVTRVLRGGYSVLFPTSREKDHYTARELIKKAGYCRGGHMNKGDLKEETHTKNRAATKQSLVHERYDEFQHNQLRATGNPWNWD